MPTARPWAGRINPSFGARHGTQEDAILCRLMSSVKSLTCRSKIRGSWALSVTLEPSYYHAGSSRYGKVEENCALHVRLFEERCSL